ncbi:PaaI family thioesterase [Mycolicibacterium sp. XJ1819]
MSPVSRADGPLAKFGVGNMRTEAAALVLEQHVSEALVDHRGQVEMSAYAVMAESTTSAVYWHSFTEQVATVQAWLAMTAGTPARVGDRLRAASELSYRDESHGTSTLTVTNTAGATVCTGVARAVRVGRNTDALRALDKGDLTGTYPLPPPTAVGGTGPAPLDPEWDGGRVLWAIARGEVAAGPMAELFSTTLTLTEAGPVLGLIPQPWMANPLGAIQGGVIASMVAHACSLAGQAHTGPDDRYTLADMSVYFFRSPAADAGALTLTTATERVGRRLATVSTTMTDHTGTAYARAVADISYQRSGE